MTLFLIVVLCALSAAWVLLPLRARAETADSEYSNVAEERSRKSLFGQQKSLTRQVKDIEFDYSMGKINDDDYQQWRADLDAQLSSVKNRLQNAASAPSARATLADDFDVEAEILVARARRKRALHNSAKTTWVCPCGRAMSDEDKFCASCGAPRVMEPAVL